jgi:sulfur carrier protein
VAAASIDAAVRAAVAVTVDGAPREVPAGSTLGELLAALGHAPHAVATAVNGAFVAREARAAHRLQPGDAVLLFQPIVGG